MLVVVTIESGIGIARGARGRDRLRRLVAVHVALLSRYGNFAKVSRYVTVSEAIRSLSKLKRVFPRFR